MVGVAQVARAPDCGSGGRGFESHHPPHENKPLLRIRVLVFIRLLADTLDYFLSGNLISG